MKLTLYPQAWMVVALTCAALVAPAVGGAAELCETSLAGAYRTSQGALLALNPVAKPRGYRWTHEDGRTGVVAEDAAGGLVQMSGWSEQPGADVVDLLACDGHAVLLNGERASKVPLIVEDVSFESQGATLHGRLVRPEGTSTSAPLVVDLQGSGRGSYLDSNQRQYLLPAQGIAVFNYDKRGTGKSTGNYTQDFHVLAEDATKGMTVAKERMARHGRRGFVGSSQGGWVAPLAAQSSPVDFVVVNYGLAYSALREDREQVLGGLHRAGWSDEATLEKADAVIQAAADVVTEQTEASMLRMERLRELYRNEPWWKDLGGEFTSFIAQTPKEELQRIAPSMDVGTSWTYDPLQTVRGLKAAQLWLVPEDDIEAPPEETLRRLELLIKEGRPVTLVRFPNTDHGIKRFILQGKERIGTRYAPGSQRVMADWIKGERLEPQGDEDFKVSGRRR